MVQLIRVLTSYNFRVYSVAWSPDGKQIASGSRDQTIKIWDSRSGDCQSTLNVDLHLLVVRSLILMVVSFEALASMLGLVGWKVTPFTLALQD